MLVWDPGGGEDVVALERAHDGPVVALGFASGGQEVVSVSARGEVLRWDAGTGTIRAEVRLDSREFLGSAASEAASDLEAGGIPPTLLEQLQDAAAHSGATLQVGPHEEGAGWRLIGGVNWTRGFTAARCGRQIAYGIDRTEDGLDIYLEDIVEASLSPDGSQIATSGARVTRIWGVDTGRLVATLESGPATDAVWSPDGTRVATAVNNDEGGGAVTMWDAATGERLWRRPQEQLVFVAAFSEQGDRLLGAGLGRARVLDALTGEPVTPPLEHEGGNQIFAIDWSRDGRWVVTGSGLGEESRVWDAATGQPVTPFLPQGSFVVDAAFSPDGRYLVTAGGKGAVRVWPLLTSSRRTAQAWRPLLHLLVGHAPDEVTGVLLPLAQEEMRELWRQERERYHRDCPPPVSAGSDWHRQRAKDAESRHEWWRVRWHTDRWLAQAKAESGKQKAKATASTANDQQQSAAQAALYAQRARARARLGDMEGALADCRTALELEPEDPRWWLQRAMVQLGSGDERGYRETCAGMLGRWGQSEEDAVLLAVARACMLAPGGVSDRGALTALAERLRQLSGADPDAVALRRGGLLCRAGRWQEAVTVLELVGLDRPDFVISNLLLAMARRRLHQPRQAEDAWRFSEQKWEQLALLSAEPWTHVVEREILRREAEGVMQEAD